MSNKLAKILMICSLIVLIPLLVVGTVLAVYFSMNDSVNIEVYENVQYGSVAAPTIGSNNATVKYVENDGIFVVTNGHNRNTVLKANLVDGLRFKGWFEGTKDEYETALASGNVPTLENTELELTIKTGDVDNLTAIYEVVKFNVTYAYDTDPTDGVDNSVSTLPSEHSSVFEYGETLPEKLTLTDNVDKTDSTLWFSMGWMVLGDETQTLYTQANFPYTADVEGDVNVTLTARWDNSAKIAHKVTVTSTDATYEKASFDYTATDMAELENLFVAEKWEITSVYKNVWEFKGITFNDEEYTTATELYNAIKATAEVDVALVGNFGCTFDTVTVNGLRVAYKDGTQYKQPYDADAEDYELAWTKAFDANGTNNYTVKTDVDVFSTGLDVAPYTLFLEDFTGAEYDYYKDEDLAEKLTATEIEFRYCTVADGVYTAQTSALTITLEELGEDTSIYHFLSLAAVKIQEAQGTVEFTADTFVLAELTLIFA